MRNFLFFFEPTNPLPSKNIPLESHIELEFISWAMKCTKTASIHVNNRIILLKTFINNTITQHVYRMWYQCICFDTYEIGCQKRLFYVYCIGTGGVLREMLSLCARSCMRPNKLYPPSPKTTTGGIYYIIYYSIYP